MMWLRIWFKFEGVWGLGDWVCNWFGFCCSVLLVFSAGVAWRCSASAVESAVLDSSVGLFCICAGSAGVVCWGWSWLFWEGYLAMKLCSRLLIDLWNSPNQLLSYYQAWSQLVLGQTKFSSCFEVAFQTAGCGFHLQFHYGQGSLYCYIAAAVAELYWFCSVRLGFCWVQFIMDRGICVSCRCCILPSRSRCG